MQLECQLLRRLFRLYQAVRVLLVCLTDESLWERPAHVECLVASVFLRVGSEATRCLVVARLALKPEVVLHVGGKVVLLVLLRGKMLLSGALVETTAHHGG